jgi:hypothetical protein
LAHRVGTIRPVAPRLTRIVPSLEGLAPFQIAFVVRDLERAAREFDARLAAGPWRGWVLVVDSVAAVTAEMEATGHPAIARIHSFGAAGDGAAAYYDTAEALGFLVEAVEPPGAMPPVDFTL